MNLSLVKLALLASGPVPRPAPRKPSFASRALPWLGAGAGLLGGAYLTRNSWGPKLTNYLGRQAAAGTTHAQGKELDAGLGDIRQRLANRSAGGSAIARASGQVAEGIPNTPVQQAAEAVSSIGRPVSYGSLGLGLGATALGKASPAAATFGKGLSRVMAPVNVGLDAAYNADMANDPNIVSLFTDPATESVEDARKMLTYGYGAGGGALSGMGSFFGPIGSMGGSLGNTAVRGTLSHLADDVAQRDQVSHYDGASMDMLLKLYQQAKGGNVRAYPALQRWIDSEVNQQSPEASSQLLGRNPALGVLASRVNALLQTGQNRPLASR